MRKTTFRFCRVHVIRSNKTEINDFFKTSLTHGVKVPDKREKDTKWSFIDVMPLVYNDEVFIYGELAKYQDIKEEEIVNEDLNTRGTAFVDKGLIARSPFIIHPKSSVIAYKVVYNKIGIGTFYTMFSKLIEVNNEDTLCNCSIDTINDEKYILEALKSFEKIERLTIELKPSNPKYREMWKDTDEKLRKMKADKYHQTYESEIGLVINEDDITYAEIIMAADGYGSAYIQGYENGRKRKASTHKHPKTTEVTQGETKENLLGELYESFKEIVDRISKH